MEATSTGHRLRVSQRVGRNLLCSLWERDKQICKVRADKVGPLPDTPEQPARVASGNPSLKQAAEAMSSIGKQCAEGTIGQADKEKLFKVRDKMVKAKLGDKKKGKHQGGHSGEEEDACHEFG